MGLKDVTAAGAFALAERGLVADSLTRAGIRMLVRGRLRSLERDEPLDEGTLRTGPIAPAPAEANEQHYEVPAAFFELVLGPWRKYSSGYWPAGDTTFEESEVAMLDLSAGRAGISEGLDVLDLGCGWGSFSLYAAQRFPSSRFTAVSHSSSQRAFIEAEASRLGVDNLEVVTRDVNDLEFDRGVFDRVVSIEMFEHMSNYELLMRRVAGWIRPGGSLFLHVFCHRERPYRFETEGAGNWMAREFFTGGMMPSRDLLPRFAGPLELESDWYIDGTHYGRTSEAWLSRLDANRPEIRRIFASTYGEEAADRWVERWRLFFLACAETFAYDDGSEWGVAHHLFRKAEAGEDDRDGTGRAT